MLEAALQGYLVAVSLILAIGAQNAFVLRQGLRREHVGAVVLACALSDAVLIAAGVTGFGAASKAAPWLGEAMRWGGVVFLLVYGGMRFRAALQGVVVDRFMTSCTDRGLSLVAPQEFRNWLLAEGVSLGFMPIQDQLSWWRSLILGLLGLLVAMVLALAFLNN